MTRKTGLADSPLFNMPRPSQGQSDSRPLEPIGRTAALQKSRSAEVQQSGTPEVPKSRSTALQQSGTTAVQKSKTKTAGDFEDYQLLDYREYKKLDARLSWEQIRYLDELEALIARKAPGLEKNNPLSKRMTKSSIVRVLVEIAMRLRLSFDPSTFRNERDLLRALDRALALKYKKRKG
jgi:hypothetical protein